MAKVETNSGLKMKGGKIFRAPILRLFEKEETFSGGRSKHYFRKIIQRSGGFFEKEERFSGQDHKGGKIFRAKRVKISM